MRGLACCAAALLCAVNVTAQSVDDWVVGVQWHPERMPDDAFAQKLFEDFVGAARKVHLETAAKR